MSGDVIDRACEALSITQKELALQAGINPARISDVKHGRLAGFSRSDTRKLLEAFPGRFTTDELMFFERAGGKRKAAAR